MTRPDDECPDTETLAAMADDTLPAVRRRDIEAHVADCHRCQALMAAVVRAESAAGITTGASAAFAWWKSRRALTWLATAAAASIGVAVWVAIPRQVAPLAVEAPQRQQGAAAPAPAPTPGPEAESKVAEATTPPSRAPSTAKAERRDEPVAPIVPAQGALEATDASRAMDAVTPARERALSLAAPAAARAPAAPPPALRTTEVVSPNAQIRWRIGPGSLVQYSADGGTTWVAQQTGATANLTAGSAPATGVCWIAGSAGTVLRTTDSGRTWLRVPFPETIDIVSIIGTTALAASIDLADGRRFGTTDGGRTWAPN